jgi:putative membrane protein
MQPTDNPNDEVPNSNQESTSEVREKRNKVSNSTLATRSVYGGVLMGLANLVPGISGGTMLLAAGIYPKFIDAIADMTRFKFRFRSLLVLGCVVASAGLAILLLAGVLKDLVVDYRWIMYSLFIGLTLGGVPLVYRMVKPIESKTVVAAIIAFAAMIGLAALQHFGYSGSGSSGFPMMVVAGLAGASAMILPGVSGGYLLLLLGQYVPILGGIDRFKDALKARDVEAAMGPAMEVVLPVGIGVVLGVVVVGNLLKWLLDRYRQATLGALLGLLLGSTIGLWPFQVGVAPKVGDVIKGKTVTESTIADIEEDDWKTEFFAPGPGQIAGSTGLVLLGFGITVAVAKLGSDED